MVQKLRRIVIAALLSIAVFGMSFSALSASAAEGNESECHHTTQIYNSTIIKYTHADFSTHTKQIDEVWLCKDCNQDIHYIQEITESHKQIPGTVFCECGYQLH